MFEQEDAVYDSRRPVLPYDHTRPTTERDWVKRTLIGIAIAFLLAVIVLPLVLVFAEAFRKGAGEYARMLISEAFARHALTLSSARVCLLLPSKWLASQARYRLFTVSPPLAVLHLCQRPSMPPGDRIAAMGNRAFRGGMVDYCWIVWDVTRAVAPGETRTVWLPPLGEPVSPVEALA